MTWDDLDLYYGHKAQEMILTDVSDTIHADSLALFALNIEILLADVTKPEKSKILTLTWPVTSSVTSGSNFWPCTGSSRTGLSNGVWNLEIGPVVWEISGGALWAPPPPAGRVTIQTPAGRGLTGRGYGPGYIQRMYVHTRISCSQELTCWLLFLVKMSQWRTHDPDFLGSTPRNWRSVTHFVSLWDHPSHSTGNVGG